ncbi:hypothetical protein VNO80_23154 [Phaseolus coccineus]|uniref:Uncharacterized protein n=1 Tax=Phaseolus coccineus TaxID=3886 RepID=A0AAN9MBY2_PHACN
MQRSFENRTKPSSSQFLREIPCCILQISVPICHHYLHHTQLCSTSLNLMLPHFLSYFSSATNFEDFDMKASGKIKKGAGGRKDGGPKKKPVTRSVGSDSNFLSKEYGYEER